MKINKRAQYGILLCIYLSNAGRATLETVSLNLGLSKSFLDQVARDLRLGGLVKSIKRPHSGYELQGDPTVGNVLSILSPVSILDKGDYAELRVGGTEQRAFANFVKNLTNGLQPLLGVRIRELTHSMAKLELSRLEGPEASA